MTILLSSGRRIPKATYVAFEPDKQNSPPGEPGKSVIKNAFIMSLNLRSGEVKAVREKMLPKASVTSQNLGQKGRALRQRIVTTSSERECWSLLTRSETIDSAVF